VRRPSTTTATDWSTRRSQQGTQRDYYVKPSVTKVAAALWIYSYEPATFSNHDQPRQWRRLLDLRSQRRDARQDARVLGSGKIPWFNVTGTEVEQTCTSMGGTVCALADWQTACQATATCKWATRLDRGSLQNIHTASKYLQPRPFDGMG